MSSTILLPRDCKYTDNYVCYAIPQAAVAGIVVASAFVLLVLLSICFCCYKKRRRARKNKEREARGEETLHSEMGYAGREAPQRIEFNPNAY
jgi:hypothetical protein